MAKYRITEEQLEKIFETFESKKMMEIDNLAPGSDTPSAPWNQKEPKTSNPYSVDGEFELVGNTFGEFLIKNKKTNQLYYTDTDAWEGLSTDNRWSDIKDELFDFLSIPQESVPNEDGGTDMVPIEDWKESIDSNDIAKALPNYMNYNTSRGNDLGVVNSEQWEDGVGKFVLITMDNLNVIRASRLKEMAITLLK